MLGVCCELYLICLQMYGGTGRYNYFTLELSGFTGVFPLLYMEGDIVVSYSGIDSHFMVVHPLDMHYEQ